MSEIPKEFLLFKTLSKSTVQDLMNEADPEQRRAFLSSELNLQESGLKLDILLDLHFNNLTYGLSQKFSAEKASCLLEIFRYCAEYSLSNRLSELQAFDIFSKLLLKHSVQRSPYSIAVFNVNELKNIIDYALHTFFRHYALYDYAFNPNCSLILKNVNRFEGNFPMVLKLEEGNEISPESILALDKYIIKPVIEEPPKELGSEEEEALITDPLQYLLEKEMKLIKSELEDKIKKQDDEFLAKIEVFKK